MDYATIHRPERANGDAIVLTHGAGATRNGPVLVGLAGRFADAGYLTVRYDLPFRRERAGGPPHPSKAAGDRAGVVEMIAEVRRMVTGRVIAGGHSYGGRQTAMAAAENPGLADSLLLLSYPLHPPAKPQQLRTAYFPELRTPALFVHGTRDPFGSIEELRAALPLIPARTDLLEVAGAGHDLKAAIAMSGEILQRMLF
jgi:predicted alpha/beta-hydrolase family hydrolase